MQHSICVRSFEKYLSKLHPICNNLWQQPLESFVVNADVWYFNSPVGRDMLAKFMYKLSVVIAELRIVPIWIFFWSDVR
jgi:hypothetical protein